MSGPLTENDFEIVAGARRYRATQIAQAATVPARIVNLNDDAEVLEARLVENMTSADVHPMDVPQGFKTFLDLEGPTCNQLYIECLKGLSEFAVNI